MKITEQIKEKFLELLSSVDGFVGIAIDQDDKGTYILLLWENKRKIDLKKLPDKLLKGNRIVHQVIGKPSLQDD